MMPMPTQARIYHAHPLNREGRLAQSQQASEDSQYVAPGVRPVDLERLFERMAPEQAMEILFALQGSRAPMFPMGGA